LLIITGLTLKLVQGSVGRSKLPYRSKTSYSNHINLWW